MARRRTDDGGLGCLGFPLFAWAGFTHLSVAPAVADATGIKAGPALFFAVFLVTPVLAVAGIFLLYVSVFMVTRWIVDAFRNL